MLTEKQKKIRVLLSKEIINENFRGLCNIFDNNENSDIQEVFSQEREDSILEETSRSLEVIILNRTIYYLDVQEKLRQV